MKSHMEFQDLQNRYENDAIVLVGNGPSLQSTPLDKLDDFYTMGMNGINYIFEDTNWRPDFYLCPKERFGRVEKEDLIENINSGGLCFVHKDLQPSLGECENVIWTDVVPLKYEKHRDEYEFHGLTQKQIENAEVEELRQFWSDDPSKYIFRYHSMYSALQIVDYMGFNPIYIVGADLGFEYNDPHMVFEESLDPYHFSGGRREYFREALDQGVFWKSFVNGTVYTLLNLAMNSRLKQHLSRTDLLADPNHFAGAYLPEIMDKRYVNNELNKAHYTSKRILDDNGKEIYNATIGGELEVYERVNLEELL